MSGTFWFAQKSFRESVSFFSVTTIDKKIVHRHKHDLTEELMSTTKLIYGISHYNANLFYATQYHAPDAYLFLLHNGRKYMIMKQLEYDKAKRLAKVDEIIRLEPFWQRTGKSIPKSDYDIDVIDEVLKEFGIKTFQVPEMSSLLLVDELRKKGYTIEGVEDPFFPERQRKTKEEKKHIETSQKAAYGAMDLVENILRKSRVRNGRLIYRNKTLTSEVLRAEIGIYLLSRGCLANDPIIAGGVQGCDPHERGTGPLKANQSIIVDIYPSSIKTGYYGDTCRTFCKGKASDALKKLYATVLDAQLACLKKIKAGVNGRTIHEANQKFFESKGYKTEEKKGRMQGFFHGTGHSLGIEPHEEPARINRRDYTLEEGNVLSVEPGLYYPDIGAVRIEDLVYVTKTGCDVIGKYPKKLEIR